MNKKGAALALVLMIGLVVAVLGTVVFTMANSSIASADTGIKSKEAYNNAKSGYDLLRTLETRVLSIADRELMIELSTKKNEPDTYYPDRLETSTEFLGYMDEAGNFVFEEKDKIPDEDFKTARVQLNLTLNRELWFVEEDEESKAGTFYSKASIEGWAKGRSDEISKFTDIFEKGIKIDFASSREREEVYAGKEAPEVDNRIILGTDVPVKYVVGDDFTYKSTQAKQWDTFYDPDTGKYYINSKLIGREIQNTSVLEELKIFSPYQVWDLTGWAPIGLDREKNMINYLKSKYPNMPKDGGTKYSVMLYEGEYYVYIAGTKNALPKPPGAAINGASANWVRLDRNL